MSESEPLIECKGVTKSFDDTVAVQDVSFQLMPGEVMSILGASGCGKTSLLRLIAGFEMVDGGQIRIYPGLVSDADNHLPPERRNIGMVFQEYALFPHLTVAQNVGFGLNGRKRGRRGQDGLTRDERRSRVRDALELVRLSGLEARYPHELSGGQQQRVALARTLAPSPIAALLDEPFSNLDASLRRNVREEVGAILRDQHIAAIFVTHDRDEAFAFADLVGVMSEGRLEQVNSPDALYNFPATPSVARIVGECYFLPGVARADVADTDIGALPYTCSDGLMPEGMRMTIRVRPQDLSVHADAGGSCVVESREYRGGETMLAIRTRSGVALRCRQAGYSSLSNGMRVTLAPRDDEVFLAFPV